MLDTSHHEIVPTSYFMQPDVVKIAHDLVGMFLVHHSKNGVVGGKIVETEAYNGRLDRASHAFRKRTPRTEVMYQNGGVAYVYLCYGIHHLFNIVTNTAGMADAVLIRAVEPTIGLEAMQRPFGRKEKYPASGPGKVGKAFGFHCSQTGLQIGNEIQIWKHRNEQQVKIECGPRIGVDYAGEDALLPWRFYETDNPNVSGKKRKAGRGTSGFSIQSSECFV